MTKKQKILLISFSAFAVISVLLIGAFVFRPSTSTTHIQTYISSQTITPEVIDQEESVDSQDIGEWPTVTPRQISNPTATPEPQIVHQVEAMDSDDSPTQTQLPDSMAEEETQTQTPSPSPTVEPSPTAESIHIAFSSEAESPFSIGKSVLGEDLWIHKFGSGPVQKLIIAGIHGGYEYNTTDLANELITYIQTNPSVIPEDTTLYIMPTFNPDGLARSHGYAGRANENNVDLNRNWDFNWKTTWNPVGCWAYLPISGGTSPFSEPEAAALRDFIFSHDFKAIISYHSAALGVFPGGAPDSDISVNLAEAIAEVVPYSYPPIHTGCETTGQFVDYTASYGIPSLDIELTNHRDSDFEINLEVLKVFLAWSQ